MEEDSGLSLHDAERAYEAVRKLYDICRIDESDRELVELDYKTLLKRIKGKVEADEDSMHEDVAAFGTVLGVDVYNAIEKSPCGGIKKAEHFFSLINVFKLDELEKEILEYKRSKQPG